MIKNKILHGISKIFFERSASGVEKFLVVSVFVCGAIVMIFELAGSRLLAPYFGGTIYVWTGIIGVIMGSLSLGYWLGGRLADKGASVEKYSQIIFFSALAIVWALITKDIIPRIFFYPLLPLEVASLLSALFLFAPASILLGLISPYAVRLSLTNLDSSGRTVGNLYAYSTLGSIVGTFLAGYFLIPFLGASNILFLLVVILIVLSISLYIPRGDGKFKSVWLMFVLKIVALVVFAGSYALMHSVENKNNARLGTISIDTEYNAIKIFQTTHKETGKQILNLAFDPFARQSSMFLDNDDLVWDYTKFYRLGKHFNPNINSALMIGGGAYSYPKAFLKENPQATIDVVEIDAGVTEVAKKYFRLNDDARLKTYNEDARVFINNSKNKYDVIFDDAFTSSLSVPFQLSTQEAIKKQYDLLTDNGVVVANIGASILGDNGRFFRAEYATFKSIFPQVYVFLVNHPTDPNIVQNIMIVALKAEANANLNSSDEQLNSYLQHLWKGDLPQDLPILTDDFAPVEYYMKKVI